MKEQSQEKLDTLKHDTKDVVDEAKNRAQAGAEHVKRGVSGDSMPLGDRIVSNVKEALHTTKADVDSAKRDIRHGAKDDADGPL